MAITDRPLPAFRFEVVLDLDQPAPGLESPLCDAAFAECDGLEATMQTRTLEVGGVNDRQIHLIGPVSYGQLTLKRGMTGNLQLWTWFGLGTRPGSVLTAHGRVTVWDSDGTPALVFTLTGCLPVRMRAPGFSAGDGRVAVEELALVDERLDLARPGDPGTAAGAAPGGRIGISIAGGLT